MLRFFAVDERAPQRRWPQWEELLRVCAFIAAVRAARGRTCRSGWFGMLILHIAMPRRSQRGVRVSEKSSSPDSPRGVKRLRADFIPFFHSSSQVE